MLAAMSRYIFGSVELKSAATTAVSTLYLASSSLATSSSLDLVLEMSITLKPRLASSMQ